MADLQAIEAAGRVAGLNEAEVPAYRIFCPYDGRTREGRAWWRGFTEGDKERCARKSHLAAIRAEQDELLARTAQRGLWSGSFSPPEEWRKGGGR